MFVNFMENVILLSMIFSSLCVLLVRNVVHSLLWLMISFLFLFFECLLLGVEFMAFLILIVYMGAMAVLFLFVVMILNISITEMDYSFLSYLPLSLFVLFFFCFEICFFIFIEYVNFNEDFIIYNDWMLNMYGLNDIFFLGNVLFVYYWYLMFLYGVVLLMPMMGAMALLSKKKFYNGN